MTEDREMRKVIISAGFGSLNSQERTPEAIRNWTYEIEEGVPEYARKDISFDLLEHSCEHSWDIVFFYNRPETDDEYKFRMSLKKACNDSVMTEELAELARLKEKYPDHS